MKKIRGIMRGLFMALLTVWYLIPGTTLALLGRDYLPLALRCRRIWARRNLRQLGVRLQRQGTVPTGGPFIFVGNHRSYIDPLLLLHDVMALPVAKAEVGAWPLIGFAARMTGILYVERESKRSRADTLTAMDKYLRRGYSVLVYPEGTTHTEPTTRAFQRGAFGLSVRTGIPVVPVAVAYQDPTDAWVGNDTFLPHFLRVFGRRRTGAKIAYGPPLTATDATDLVAQTKTWIDEKMVSLRQEFPARPTMAAAR